MADLRLRTNVSPAGVCATCGGELYSDKQDRTFLADYLRLKTSAERRTNILIGVLVVVIGIVVQAPYRAPPLVPILVGVLAGWLVERIRYLRLSPGQRALRRAFQTPTITYRFLTSTPMLVAVFCSILFALQQIKILGPVFQEGILVPQDILAGKHLFSLVSAMFLHANYVHVTSNVYAMVFLATRLDFHVGRWRTLVVFLVTGVVANVASAFLLSPDDMLLGASGGIMGLGAAGAFSLPPLYGRPGTERRSAVASAILLTVGDAYINWLSHDDVAWQAHVCGFVSGAILGVVWLRKMPISEDYIALSGALGIRTSP